jgi:membrane carboxypeptidase/penicillin-binding protein
MLTIILYISLIFLVLAILIIRYVFWIYKTIDLEPLKDKVTINTVRPKIKREAGLKSEHFVHVNRLPGVFCLLLILHEDDIFFEHKGLNFPEIKARLYAFLFKGGKLAGGSSITQQLAKNIFRKAKRSFLSKLKEAVISIKLESDFAKEEILGLYLASIFFGKIPYGLQAATQHYFKKKPEYLTLSESMLLISLIPSPTEHFLFKLADDSNFAYHTCFEKVKQALRICLLKKGDADLDILANLEYGEVRKIMQEYSKLNISCLAISQEQDVAICAAEATYQVKSLIEARWQD